MDKQQILIDFMTWLTSRAERSGPFGANWGPEPAIALVAEYLAQLEPVQTTAPSVDKTTK